MFGRTIVEPASGRSHLEICQYLLATMRVGILTSRAGITGTSGEPRESVDDVSSTRTTDWSFRPRGDIPPVAGIEFDAMK